MDSYGGGRDPYPSRDYYPSRDPYPRDSHPYDRRPPPR